MHAVECQVTGPTTIVRLVPAELVTAEKTTFTALGGVALGHHPVGYGPNRAVGFPAWPIMLDPANAHKAIPLLKTLDWVKRKVDTSPIKVKEKFEQLSFELMETTPLLVPTLLEEAARLFLAVDRKTYAQQLFGWARDLEQTHDLPIDAQQQVAVHQEFAEVLRVKDIQALAQVLDFDAFLAFITQRMAAGAGAYAKLAHDMRALGRPLGMTAKESDRTLLAAIVGTPGFRRSATGFFRAVRGTLIEMGWETVLVEKPEKLAPGLYLELLRDMGAPLGQPVVDLFNAHCRFPELIDAATAAGADLAGRHVVFGGYGLDLDLMEVLVANGATWEVQSLEHVIWQDWFDNPKRHNLTALTASDLGEPLAEGLSAETIAAHASCLQENAPELLAIRMRQFAAQRDQAIGSASAWEQFKDDVLQHLRELPTTITEKLFEIDLAMELCVRLRRGLTMELTWPAVEALSADEIYGTHPGVVVQTGDALTAIDDNRVIASKTCPIDAKICNVEVVGEHILIATEQQIGWLGHELKPNHGLCRAGFSVPWEDGRLTGYGLVRYPEIPNGCGGHVLGTGPHYLMEDDDFPVTEYETGIQRSQEYFQSLCRGEEIPGISLAGLVTSELPRDAEFMFKQSRPECLVFHEYHESILRALNIPQVSHL